MTAILASGLAAYVLTGFNSLAPVLIAPLVSGVIAGLLRASRVEAGLVGFMGYTAGFWAAVFAFDPSRVSRVVSAAPPYAHVDIIMQAVYGELVGGIVLADSVAKANDFALWFIGSLVALLASFATALLSTSYDMHRPGKWLFFGALGLVCVSTLFTLYGNTSEFRRSLQFEPAEGTYAVDHLIFAKVHWLMDRGVPYYEALPAAAAGDVRLAESGAVRNGKFVGWATSPSMVRQPWSFWALRILSPSGTRGVFAVSAVAVVAVLVSLGLSLSSRSQGAALVAAVFVVPYLIMGAGWHNLLLPDWWAALTVLMSIAAALADRVTFKYLAILLAVMAASFRETAVLWLLVLLCVSWFAWARNRRPEDLWLADAVTAGALVFSLMYTLHIRSAELIIEATRSESLLSVLRSQARMPIETRFFGPTSYLMFPYGQFAVPGYVLAVAGAIGLILWGIGRRDVMLSAAGGYVAIWLIYLLVMGTFSSYWGVLFMAVALAGLGFSVAACADDALEWRTS